ncbi:MAG: 4'-phosphopantetheinyl transferase family protein [Bacteroidales bacterium]
MPVIQHIKNDRYQIGIWKITESEEEFLTSLSKYPNVCCEVNAFKSHTRKIEFLSVRCLIYELLGHLPVIKYTETGKPYFAENNLHLSITHTKGNFAAVILSEDPFIGIDIEIPSDRVLRIENKFLSADEISLINPSSRIETLMIMWSAKETLFKAIDTNEIDFKKHLKIKDFTNFPATALLTEFSKEKAFWTGHIQYISNNEFIMTWLHTIQ